MTDLAHNKGCVMKYFTGDKQAEMLKRISQVDEGLRPDGKIKITAAKGVSLRSTTTDPKAQAIAEDIVTAVKDGKNIEDAFRQGAVDIHFNTQNNKSWGVVSRGVRDNLQHDLWNSKIGPLFNSNNWGKHKGLMDAWLGRGGTEAEQAAIKDFKEIITSKIDELELLQPDHPVAARLRKALENPQQLDNRKLRGMQKFANDMAPLVKAPAGMTGEELAKRIYKQNREIAAGVLDPDEAQLAFEFKSLDDHNKFMELYGEENILYQLDRFKDEVTFNLAKQLWSGGESAKHMFFGLHGKEGIVGKIRDMIDNDPSISQRQKDTDFSEGKIKDMERMADGLARTIDNERPNKNIWEEEAFLSKNQRAHEGVTADTRTIAGKLAGVLQTDNIRDFAYIQGLLFVKWIPRVALPATRTLQLLRDLKASIIPIAASDGNFVSLQLAKDGLQSKTKLFGGNRLGAQLDYFGNMLKIDQHSQLNRTGFVVNNYMRSVGGATVNRFGESQTAMQNWTDKAAREWGRVSGMNRISSAAQRTVIMEYAANVGDAVAKGSWEGLSEVEQMLFKRMSWGPEFYNKLVGKTMKRTDGMFSANFVDVSKLDYETKVLFQGTIATRAEQAIALPNIHVQSLKHKTTDFLKASPSSYRAELVNALWYLQSFPVSMTWQRAYPLFFKRGVEHQATNADITAITAQSTITGTLGVYAREQLWASEEDRKGFADWIDDDPVRNIMKGWMFGIPYGNMVFDNTLGNISNPGTSQGAIQDLLNNPRTAELTSARGHAIGIAKIGVDALTNLYSGKEELDVPQEGLNAWNALEHITPVPQTTPLSLFGRMLAGITDSDDALAKDAEPNLESYVYQHILGSGNK